MKHIRDYKNFHGMDKAVVTSASYEPPKEPLVNLGEIVSIEYKPEFPSKSRGTIFTHKMGDTGIKTFKSNCILATDGKNFFILKKDNKKKRPVFTERGIVG